MKICQEPEEYRVNQIDTVVDGLLTLLSKTDIMGFTGPLGAGKTTLVQQLLRRCGVTQPIVSPTFSYVQSYRVGSQLYHHFDLYRLTALDDFIQAGFDEYLYQPESKALIEWPEIIIPLLNQRACLVQLDYVDETARRVAVCCTD